MIDSTLKNANILIVDDKQPNIDVLTGLLDLKGFPYYTTTTDSRQVYKLFDEFKPDLILLDLKMPYLTGFEVMTQLKVLIPPNTFIPILVLTADITPESKQRALECGANDFLTKPFDLIEVELRIRNQLKIRYLHQQLENQNQYLKEKVKEGTKKIEKTNIELKVVKENAEHTDKLNSELLSQLEIEKSQKNQNEHLIGTTSLAADTSTNDGTILYVNESSADFQLIEQILKTHRPGIRLISNAYGRNAVQFAIDYSSDLILLDLHLPDLHGSEVIRLLQADPKTEQIPVIILSADAMTKQIEQLMNAGAEDYLVKPIDVENFMKLVDTRIKKSSN